MKRVAKKSRPMTRGIREDKEYQMKGGEERVWQKQKGQERREKAQTCTVVCKPGRGRRERGKSRFGRVSGSGDKN